MRKLTGFETAQLARECGTSVEEIRRIEQRVDADFANGEKETLLDEAEIRNPCK